jgi:hypothetical protein
MKITIEFDPISEPTLARQIASLLAPTRQEALAELQAAAEAACEYTVDNTGDYVPPVTPPAVPAGPDLATTVVRRRGRPPKNAEAATVIAAPSNQPVLPVSGPAAASDAATAPTVAVEAPPASTQQPGDVLEMIYNRDGAATAIAVLARFGVARLRDLKPEQTADFVGYCQEVIAGIAKPVEGDK